MPPRRRVLARGEASGESSAQAHDPAPRGRGRGRGRDQGRGRSRGRRGVAARAANVEVPRARRGDPAIAELTAGMQGLQQAVQQLVGIVAAQQHEEQQQINTEPQQEVRQVEPPTTATARELEATLAEFMKLKSPTFSGSDATEDPQRFLDRLERLWRALGCSDIRAVELTSYQLEGAAYDWYDTVSRGRPAGSPPLAWGEFTQLFMARFLLESVRDALTHEFERLEQTEGMSVS